MISDGKILAFPGAQIDSAVNDGERIEIGPDYFDQFDTSSPIKIEEIVRLYNELTEYNNLKRRKVEFSGNNRLSPLDEDQPNSRFEGRVISIGALSPRCLKILSYFSADDLAKFGLSEQLYLALKLESRNPDSFQKKLKMDVKSILASILLGDPYIPNTEGRRNKPIEDKVSESLKYLSAELSRILDPELEMEWLRYTQPELSTTIDEIQSNKFLSEQRKALLLEQLHNYVVEINELSWTEFSLEKFTETYIAALENRLDHEYHNKKHSLSVAVFLLNKINNFSYSEELIPRTKQVIESIVPATRQLLKRKIIEMTMNYLQKTTDPDPWLLDGALSSVDINMLQDSDTRDKVVKILKALIDSPKSDIAHMGMALQRSSIATNLSWVTSLLNELDDHLTKRIVVSSVNNIMESFSFIVGKQSLDNQSHFLLRITIANVLNTIDNLVSIVKQDENYDGLLDKIAVTAETLLKIVPEVRKMKDPVKIVNEIVNYRVNNSNEQMVATHKYFWETVLAELQGEVTPDTHLKEA